MSAVILAVAFGHLIILISNKSSMNFEAGSSGCSARRAGNRHRPAEISKQLTAGMHGPQSDRAADDWADSSLSEETGIMMRPVTDFRRSARTGDPRGDPQVRARARGIAFTADLRRRLADRWRTHRK